MDLRTAALELGKLTGIIETGTATDGTTTKLIDTSIEFPPGKYANGTLWLLTGDNAGACEKIIESAAGSFTIGTAFSTAIAAGDLYAVGLPKFTKNDLIQAINFVLSHTQIIQVDETLSVVNSDQYALPTGVKNVKRVYIAGSNTAPYAWNENNSWEELNGNLIFHPGKHPTDTGKIIRLVYKSYHGELQEEEIVEGDETDLDQSLNEDYILWAAAEQLWRMQVHRMGKDDPFAIDFLNEAKAEKEREKSIGKSVTVERSVRFSRF